jgi:hypothetical protein
MLVAVEVVHRQAEALDRYWESRNTAPVAPARARRGAAATAEATPTAPAATKHRHMYGPAGTCVRSGCTQVKRGPGRPTADEAPSLGLPGTDAPDAAAPEEV